MAPGFQPYSALGFCWVLNSWIASIGKDDEVSPEKLLPLTTLRAEGTDHISTRKQIGSEVLSGFIRSQPSRCASIDIGDSDVRTRQDRAGLIQNGPQNTPGIGLGDQRDAKQNNTHCRTKNDRRYAGALESPRSHYHGIHKRP